MWILTDSTQCVSSNELRQELKWGSKHFVSWIVINLESAYWLNELNIVIDTKLLKFYERHCDFLHAPLKHSIRSVHRSTLFQFVWQLIYDNSLSCFYSTTADCFGALPACGCRTDSFLHNKDLTWSFCLPKRQRVEGLTTSVTGSRYHFIIFLENWSCTP